MVLIDKAEESWQKIHKLSSGQETHALYRTQRLALRLQFPLSPGVAPSLTQLPMFLVQLCVCPPLVTIAVSEASSSLLTAGLTYLGLCLRMKLTYTQESLQREAKLFLALIHRLGDAVYITRPWTTDRRSEY